MWNTNDCMTNAQRAAALVPRMNKVLEVARRLGMQIIWAPTDVVNYYAGTPQRERALGPTFANTDIIFSCRRPRIGGWHILAYR